MSNSEKKSHTLELPNMPDGTVPSDIRAGAEAVVLRRMEIKNLREELKTQEESLMVNMMREKIGVAVVVMDGRKYRIFCNGSAPKIAIKEEGITPEFSNGKAPKG